MGAVGHRVALSGRMHQRRTKINSVLFAIWLVVASATSIMWSASSAQADARTDFLVRMLSTSAQFRVRAQAALALGQQTPDRSIVGALVSALRDEHPAVRAASASALERLKDPTAIAGLKAAQSDGDSSVRTAVRNALAALQPAAASARVAPTPSPTPSGTPVYYVGVGVPGSQVGLSAPTLRNLRQYVVSQLAQIEGVSVAPENEDRRAASQVIGAQKLVGYYIDSSVTSVEQKPDGSVRVQVSIIVGTYPGRDMRAMLSGAATVSGGGSGDAAKEQAAQAAFSGALRRLPQAMQAGLARTQ